MPDWIISTAASVWGLVMALAPILQIMRMLKHRSSRDVSLGYFWLLLPGFLLWVAHGSTTGDVFLIVPNALAALMGACLIAVATWLRRDERLNRSHPIDQRKSRQ